MDNLKLPGQRVRWEVPHVPGITDVDDLPGVETMWVYGTISSISRDQQLIILGDDGDFVYRTQSTVEACDIMAPVTMDNVALCCKYLTRGLGSQSAAVGGVALLSTIHSYKSGAGITGEQILDALKRKHEQKEGAVS